MASEIEITKIILILTAAYPHANLVESSGEIPGTVEVYAAMLSDIPPLELLAAVKYCIRTYPQFMPTVATLREAVAKMHKAGQTVSGADAWGIVIQAVREIGIYGRPKFADPAITRAVECFGWRNICLSDCDDFAIRAQFIKAWEKYSQVCQEEAELVKIPEARQIMLQLVEKKKVFQITEG